MQSKSQLVNTNETWNAKKRYKINSVVSYLGITYQNGSGKNSDPSLNLGDWIVISGESVGLEEAPIDGLQYARQDATWTEVTGGGGGSQDLENVLGVGNTAANDILLTEGSGVYIYASGDMVYEVGAFLTGINGGELRLFNNLGSTLIPNTIIPNTNQTISGSFELPIGNGATQTLATLDDIANSVNLDGAQTITGYKTIASDMLFSLEDGKETSVGPYSITMNNFSILKYMNLNADYINFANSSNDHVAVNAISLDMYNDSDGFHFVLKKSEDLTSSIEVFSPSDSGTLALKEDALQVFTDPTTVVLSAATLDSSYPTAKTGDRVHAISIIAGALMYEKTSTGWVGFPVAVIV